MNIYLLTQDEVLGYDTYDACVVVAYSPEQAAKMHPGRPGDDTSWFDKPEKYPSWASDPKNVQIEYLGKAFNQEIGVVCASFNAG